MRPLLYPLGEVVHYELSDLWGTDEHCHRHGGLAAGFPGRVEEEAGGYGVFQPPSYSEGTGCPAGALSILRRAFISVALVDFSDFFHTVSCTHSAGAAPAASGTVGPTSPRIWKQAWCLLQVWQRWPLCPGVSPEPASSVYSIIGELQASQEDHDQEESAQQIWTGAFHKC